MSLCLCARESVWMGFARINVPDRCSNYCRSINSTGVSVCFGEFRVSREKQHDKKKKKKRVPTLTDGWAY